MCVATRLQSGCLVTPAMQTLTKIFAEPGPLRFTAGVAGGSITWENRSVKVGELAFQAEPVVSLVADICAEHEWDARAALLANDKLGGGAIALHQGAYVVRYVVPLSKVTRELVSTLAKHVNGLAASLRTGLPSRGFEDELMFGMFAE
jgi:hypothetical protein